MESALKIQDYILCHKENELKSMLSSGLDPNFEGGWPIRLAARHGYYSLVKMFIQYGANPHLLGNSGASTLQLAVYADKHWDTDVWSPLLSCCDSSQLADGAAVAVIFRNIAALKRILETGRCNTNIPTTLTGKTVENLAKGYKLNYLLNMSTIVNSNTDITPNSSPRPTRTNLMQEAGTSASPQQPIRRTLSPSVARFFDQAANQTSLSPSRNWMATDQ